MHMIDNLGGRLGSFDRLEKELAPGAAGRPSIARSARARSSRERGPSSERRRPRAGSAGAPGRLKAPQIAAGGRRPRRNGARRLASIVAGPMAKDTEKLIRQLSLISYLMAERRPVTALEIRRDVEGYSGMNEDAFARRFYADRSELESLRIQLTVERPPTAPPSRRTTRCARRTSTCPRSSSPTRSSRRCRRRSACSTANSPTPSRCGWRCSRSPGGARARCAAPEQSSVALGITALGRRARADGAPGEDRDGDLPQQDDPVRLLHDGARRGGRPPGGPLPPALPGRASSTCSAYSHERKAIRVFRLSRIRGKVSYATKAEHDFRRPADFDPRGYANRADWQLGEEMGVAEIQVSERIAWQVERHFGRYGEIRHEDGETVFLTGYSNARGIISWVLGLGGNARLLGPEELVGELDRRLELLEGSPPRGSAERGRVRLAPRPARPGPPRERRRRSLPGGAPGREGRRRERSCRSRHPPGALRPPGHAREHPDPRRPRRRAGADRRGARAPAAERGGAARGRQRAERRQLRRRLLRAVRGDQRATGRSRSTRSPTATTSTAPRGCCRSRPRRWWRRST